MKEKRQKLANELGEGCTESMHGNDLNIHGEGFYKLKLYEKAMNCFLIAHKAGVLNATSYHRIGFMYEIGLGVEENMTEAMKWYKLSAEN